MNTNPRIREIRKNKGMTMKQLALEVGVTEQAISQYERGIRRPNEEISEKLAKALGVNQTAFISTSLARVHLYSVEALAKYVKLLIKDDDSISWEENIKGFTVEEISRTSEALTIYARKVIIDRKTKVPSDESLIKVHVDSSREVDISPEEEGHFTIKYKNK